MSAVAPLPRPEEPPDTAAADAEGWALLEGLRRRLDEQGTQQRKTSAQVSQLAESIAALVEIQRRRVRRLNLNSFVAYVIFTLLCAAGCFLLYRSRARELVAGRDQAVTERDAAVRRADDATGSAAARTDAEARAWEVYQLLIAGKRSDAAGKLAALRDLPLSRIERAALSERAQQSQIMESDAALKAAIAATRAGRYADVIAPLQAVLAGEPPGPRAAQMHYYLGVALAKGNDLDGSIAQLQAAVAADVEQEDARFQLASALDRSGAWGKARAEYDRFSTAHPQSPLAAFAMRRSATLARMPVQAPAPMAPATPVLPPAKAIAPAVVAPPAVTPGLPAKAVAATPAPAKLVVPAPSAVPTKPIAAPAKAIVAPPKPVVAPPASPTSGAAPAAPAASSPPASTAPVPATAPAGESPPTE